MGFPKIRDTSREPNNKDCSILGPYWDPFVLGNYKNVTR